MVPYLMISFVYQTGLIFIINSQEWSNKKWSNGNCSIYFSLFRPFYWPLVLFAPSTWIIDTGNGHVSISRIILLEKFKYNRPETEKLALKISEGQVRIRPNQCQPIHPAMIDCLGANKNANRENYNAHTQRSNE